MEIWEQNGVKNRKFERYVPDNNVRVFNSITDKPIGSVVNISMGGFLLITESPSIPEGAVFQLTLRCRNDEKSISDVSLGATCLWHARGNSRDNNWNGFQIIDISEDQEAALKNYINTLETISP